MAYNSLPMLPSLFGRRFGIQQMSSNVSGSNRAGLVPDMLIGPEALRLGVTTAESTGTAVMAWGISVLPGTSAASSAVYVLDPPIPGVGKTIHGGTANGPVYFRTLNSETFLSSMGSTFTTIKISSIGGAIQLLGLTTAVWLALNLTSGTSSQASGFGATTST